MEPGSFRDRLKQIKTLPSKERRASFEVLKQDVHKADELATQVADDLWTWAQQDPPPEAEDFRGYVEELALPDWMQKEVFAAIDQYAIRREKIQQIQSEKIEPEQLFYKCFGLWPAGAIDFKINAVAVNFLVYSDEDYAAAYAYQLRNDPDTFAVRKERALMSGGCAFTNTLFPDGKNIFTIVRVPKANQELARSNKVLRFHHIIAPDARTLEDDAIITKLLYRGKSVEILFSRSSGAITELVLEQKSREITLMMGEQVINGSFKLPPSDSVELYAQFEGCPGRVRLKLDCRTGRLEIRNRTHADMTSEVICYEKRPRLIPNKWVTEMIDHETQHQWNTLFLPTSEPIVSLPMQLAKIIERSEERPDEAKWETLDTIFSYGRKDTRFGSALHRAEVRGRDEILAYYRTGRAPEEILTLLNREQYNFFQEKEAASLKEEVRGYLAAFRSMYRAHFHGKDPGSFSERQLDVYINLLKLRYERQIVGGVCAIESLRRQGFLPSLIVSMMYKANITDWPSVARRAIERKKIKDQLEQAV